MNQNGRTLVISIQILVVALAITGFFVVPRHEVPVQTEADHRLASVLADIDSNQLMQTVSVLASERTRHFSSKGATAAANYITEQLTAFGYRVEQQYINVAAPDGQSIVVTNVLCDLGSGGRPPLLLCAHYDSRGELAVDAAPGADDNASGVAVLLETARVLAANQVQANVRLAFFGGEEDAFIGSQGYVDDVAVTLPSAVINVDMVGFDEYGPMDMVAFSNRASTPIVQALERAALAHTRIQLVTQFEQTGNSDHVTFWKRGVPAISLWEGYDHSPYAHSENDTPEHLSPVFLSEVTRLVTAVAMRLGTPDGDTIGLAPSPRVTWFGSTSTRVSQRFIGERFVDALPPLDSRLAVLTYQGRVVREWILPTDRADAGVLSAVGEAPGVYLLSHVVDDMHVPVRAIVVE